VNLSPNTPTKRFALPAWIKAYKGVPEVVAEQPSQIEIQK
jgi:hypothetical protein